MEFSFFGIKITIGDSRKTALSKSGAAAKKETTKQKLSNALQQMQNQNIKYSEYKLQQMSGLSINTIKKYRIYIEELKK